MFLHPRDTLPFAIRHNASCAVFHIISYFDFHSHQGRCHLCPVRWIGSMRTCFVGLNKVLSALLDPPRFWIALWDTQTSPLLSNSSKQLSSFVFEPPSVIANKLPFISVLTSTIKTVHKRKLPLLELNVKSENVMWVNRIYLGRNAESELHSNRIGQTITV